MFNKDQNPEGSDKEDNEEVKEQMGIQALNFLNSLSDTALEHKNLLLEVINRELVNKGNYLNCEGNCLSVKSFIREWDTDSLYTALKSPDEFKLI